MSKMDPIELQVSTVKGGKTSSKSVVLPRSANMNKEKGMLLLETLTYRLIESSQFTSDFLSFPQEISSTSV